MGRKGNDYPGVEIRENSVRIYFTWQGRLCREPLPFKPTLANLKRAARLRDEIVQRIRVGAFVYEHYFPNSKRAGQSRRPTFGELAQRWVNANAHLARSTLNGYRKILEQLYMPALTDRQIDKIPYSELASLIASHPWRSGKTRNNALTPLKGVFEMALLDGAIENDPTARLKAVKSQKPSPDPLTLEEVRLLLDWMVKHQGDAVRNLFEIAIFTGLRTSELIALQWGDIDFNAGLLRIQRAKVLKQYKGTKTSQIRDVELNSLAMAALQRHKAHGFLAGGTVFLHPRIREPFNDDKPVRLLWDAALKAVGIRHRIAYQTRHTFATLNLMAGANPMWVARQMGHTTMKMTLERYGRWIDSADRGNERAKLEARLWEYFGKKSGEPWETMDKPFIDNQ